MSTGECHSDLDEIQLLVTRLRDVRLGFDTDFVNGIRELEDLKRENVELFSLYEKMLFPNDEIPFKAPKVLLFNPSHDRSAGLVIEAPEDLLTVRTELISAMPPLVKKHIAPPAIWGAVQRAEDIILLIDLSKITF